MAVIIIGLALSRFYRKVAPEEALVRSGGGQLAVATGQGMWVFPIVHRVDRMDLTLKRIEIARQGNDGLICRDNIRADIKVAFFVRVDKEDEKIKEVAQSIGCTRASDELTLTDLFDAKFSEALKTVGKQFDFVDLYDKREQFKAEIIKVIGIDLNGYRLDDAAIDYLEQTSVELLDPNNILDAEGIKKITDLTAKEHVRSNDITREKEKVIKKQDVEAREVILNLERQQIEAEEKMKRESTEIRAREQAEARKVQEQERLKAETARIQTEEELRVAEENKDRQIIVAEKNKQRTEAVEVERVERDRMLEVTERDRLVGIAEVEKDKAIEVENRSIQEVIRERVMVERAVVEEQEKIKDTHEFAAAERLKKVTVTKAEMTAEQNLVIEVKAAEATKQAASLKAEQVVIEADAQRNAAERKTQAMKMLAEGRTAEEAAEGLAKAHVQIANADAIEKTGTAEATVIEKKAMAEASGVGAMAEAKEKDGTAEANVMKLKFSSEANGITEKAKAMKLFDGVGREHEEFKLRLNKDKDIEIAAIQAQQEIAEAQSTLVGEALKSARIDIVGGESEFFDKIVDSVKGGKAVDRFIHNSEVLTDVKNTFFNGNSEYFKEKTQQLVDQFNLSPDDVKDLSISALILKMLGMTDADETRSELNRLLDTVHQLGVSDKRLAALGINQAKAKQ
ncbi:flotillin family protein [Aeoliella mucimassa]|uniref:flotillin family protein n=1 Tax=Aeoliella mucimassa TaxID=2527972 RepID=UPI001E53DB86|nr:flotillin family protein [Aeoliella mucimassa]